jgi:hypothetical protein
VIPDSDHFVNALAAELANAPRPEITPLPDATAAQLEKLRAAAWVRLRDCRDPDALAAEAFALDEARYLGCTLSPAMLDELVDALVAKREATAIEYEPVFPNAPPIFLEKSGAIVQEPEPEPAPLPTPWDREELLAFFAQSVTAFQHRCKAKGRMVPCQAEIHQTLAASWGYGSNGNVQDGLHSDRSKKKNRQQQEKASAKSLILAFMQRQPTTRVTVRDIAQLLGLDETKERTALNYMKELWKVEEIRGDKFSVVTCQARIVNGQYEKAKSTKLWRFWIED